jgi:hypothetical protein
MNICSRIEKKRSNQVYTHIHEPLAFILVMKREGAEELEGIYGS